MFEPKDEELHPAGREEHWQESWYFNWASGDGRSFGLSRIGYRFHQKQIDGLVLTLRDGKPEYIYPAVNRPLKDKPEHITARDGLKAMGLTYRLLEPFSRWKLELKGRDEMDLEWSAFTPVFDFHADGADLPPNVAGNHFEQAGTVTGWTRFKGKEREIRGRGERDKSWGVRDWSKVEGWNWISAQFGEDLTFNVWQGFFEGKPYANGFVFSDGKNSGVVKLNISFEWGAREHIPAKTFIDFTTRDGSAYRVTASTLARFPLVKNGLWLEEIHASFTIARNGGPERLGVGVIEHAWHAGTFKTLRHAGELLKAAGQVLLP